MNRLVKYLHRIIEENGTTDHVWLVTEAMDILTDVPAALDDLGFLDQLVTLWRHHATLTREESAEPLRGASAAFASTLETCAEQLESRLKIVRSLRPDQLTKSSPPTQ